MPDKLIYDRTAADVARVNELMRKVRAGSATDAEREEWLGGRMKGAWNASDLNRINDWLAYLADFLEAQGYSAAVFLRHTPWTKADFPTILIESVATWKHFKIASSLCQTGAKLCTMER